MIITHKLTDAELSNPTSEVLSDDSLISDWANESIYQVKDNGIGNNTSDPRGSASKQVAMVILNRILNTFGK
jgi:hypothetical protein